MENIKKYSKLKAELLHKKEMSLLKVASGLQRKLLDTIFEDFISKLDVENGYVKNTKANKQRILTLNKLFERFQNSDFAKAMGTMVNDLKDIQALNVSYFSEINKEKINGIKNKVFDRVKSNLGIEGNKLTHGGFLDSFIKDPVILNKVRQTTLKAVTSDNITMKDYRESIKRIVVGEKGVDGGFEKHFKTFATDTYTMFDRQTNTEFATALGMKYAIYAGGLIETSRPFCIERNNKVFTSEEIKKFGTSADKYGGYENKSEGYFRGKPKTDVYDPFIQCGGYNCRHTLNYITESLAKRLRPDI